MAAPSVCPEVPSRLLAAVTPSAAVGPGPRRVRVSKHWGRGRPRSGAQAAADAARGAAGDGCVWEGRAVDWDRTRTEGSPPNTSVRGAARRAGPRTQACEGLGALVVVEPDAAPAGPSFSRSLRQRWPSSSFLICETAAAVLTLENCFECDGKSSMRLTGPAVSVSVPSCCTVRDGSKPERLVRTAVTEGPNLGEARL
ncbi:hypothetical protein R6Z07F_003583 [Ovis aries]